MTDLLDDVIAAHGGMDAWDRLQTVQGQFRIGGAIWVFKSVPDVLADVTISAQLHTQDITICPVGGAGNSSVFADRRLEWRSESGAVLETRTDPKTLLEGVSYDAAWDAQQAAYFASEAWWTYLTAPFLFTHNGFHTQEVAPFVEDGNSYRTLQVTFPTGIDSHTTEQFFHFRPDGLLHRHTYTVDILSGATGANYPSEYRTINGIAVPMVRRIYGYDEDLQKIPDPVLVSIDVHQLLFS